jgi:hypothetical protein
MASWRPLIRSSRDSVSLASGMVSEFKIADGKGYRRQDAKASLSKEMRNILAGNKSEHCLIAIPTMDSAGAKYRVETMNPETRYHGWHRHRERFAQYLNPEIEYWSAFITRPDSAQWINTLEYAKQFQSLWLGRKVAVIGSSPDGKENKILRAVRFTQEAQFIECAFKGAYGQIDDLHKQALKSGADLILISAGVTATCLAHRLSPKVQALDVGSIGGFLCKMLAGEESEPEEK